MYIFEGLKFFSVALKIYKIHVLGEAFLLLTIRMSMVTKLVRVILMSHLNINSIRNKFLDFKELVLSETDIYLISETKLDDSFPDQLCHVNGYKMFRKFSPFR